MSLVGGAYLEGGEKDVIYHANTSGGGGSFLVSYGYGDEMSDDDIVPTNTQELSQPTLDRSSSIVGEQSIGASLSIDYDPMETDVSLTLSYEASQDVTMGDRTGSALHNFIASPEPAIDYASWKDEFPISEETPKRLAKKVTELLEFKRSGGNINRDLVRKQSFNNPDILEVLIQANSLLEIGTNYQSDIYNPYRWEEGSFYDALGTAQATYVQNREEEAKKEKENREKEKEREREQERERLKARDEERKRERENRDSRGGDRDRRDSRGGDRDRERDYRDNRDRDRRDSRGGDRDRDRDHRDRDRDHRDRRDRR